MKRLGASFLGALVVVLAMFWPAFNFFSTTDETPEFARITDYRAAFDVDADGTMRAHETLTVDFPLGRHGIFRFFDIADANSPHVRYVPKDIVVTRDGRSDGVAILHQGEGRFVVARIGEADTTISGTHVYDIRYRVDGVAHRQRLRLAVLLEPDPRRLADADRPEHADRAPPGTPGRRSARSASTAPAGATPPSTAAR